MLSRQLTLIGMTAIASTLAACGTGPPVGSTAPEFSAMTASGHAFDLQDKRGTIILIDFYANW